MEGFQQELLVILLYMTLIYEVITGLQKRASKIEMMKKMSTTDSKRNREKNSSENNEHSRHKTARHFVQMRIVGRD